MPGDTLYVRNLQIESNTSASGNGFSSTGYGNLSYDGTEILGTGGVGNWTKDGTSIYYDGGNVGIQNTNPQHALSIGSPSNLYVDTVNSQIIVDADLIPRLNGQVDIGSGPSRINKLWADRLDTVADSTIGQRSINGGTQRIAGNTVLIDPFNGQTTFGSPSNVVIDTTTTGFVGIQNTNPTRALVVGEPGNSATDVEINSSVVINGGTSMLGTLAITNGVLQVGESSVGLDVNAVNGDVKLPSLSYNTGIEANLVSRVSSTGQLIDHGLLPSFLAYTGANTSNAVGQNYIDFNNSFPHLFNNVFSESYDISFRIIRLSGDEGPIGLQFKTTTGSFLNTGYYNGGTRHTSITNMCVISSNLSSTSTVFNIKVGRSGQHLDLISSGINCAPTGPSGAGNEAFLTSCILVIGNDSILIDSVRVIVTSPSNNISFNISDFKSIARSTV